MSNCLRFALTSLALVLCFESSHGKRAEFARLPMHFEPNQGQTDAEARFVSRGHGYALFLTPAEAVLTLHGGGSQQSAVLRMRLVGANPEPRISGADPLGGTVSYFHGNKPEHWQVGLPLFEKVSYSNIYPGIDLLYYGNQQQLEYDFVVSPGADPQRIELAFEGADAITVDDEGHLCLRVLGREVRWLKPFVYQQMAGTRRQVPCRYVVKPAMRVGFELDAYDRTEAVVIDPIMVYSTFLGGDDLDAAEAVAADRNGNVYVTGETLSLNFPTRRALRPASAGSNEVFVAKIDATGANLVYSTYLGGSADEIGRGIFVDRNGIAYITGETGSPNFPTRSAYQSSLTGDLDAFLVKLSAAGTNILYSSYLGGGDYESGNAVTADINGNAYIAGETFSGNSFPKKNPVQNNPGGFLDVFVARFETTAAGSASLDWSSQWGSDDDERANGVALDSDTNVVVVGEVLAFDFTTSTFPVRGNPLQPSYGGGGGDAFVMKINSVAPANPSVVFSTFLGGEGEDSATDVDVDTGDLIYVAGRTTSPDFPTLNGFQDIISNPFSGLADAFVTRLSRSGSTVLYSTFLGGEVIDEANGLGVDADGYVYISGRTTSPDFPVTPGADQTNYAGGISDAFAVKINPAFSGPESLIYSTFLGGSDFDAASGLDVDSSGNFYVAGITASPMFPVTTGVVQPSFGGGYSDAFVIKIPSPPDLAVTVVSSLNPVPVASTFYYTNRVSNNGRTSFTGVVFSNALPAGVQFLSVDTTRGSCSQAAGVIICQLGLMTNDARATITIRVRGETPTIVTNIARVTAAEAEANLANNTAREISDIKAQVDLSVAQGSVPNPVPYSSNLTHTITIRNNSTIAARDVVLTHELPPSGGSFSFTPSQGGCVLNGTSLVCALGTLNASGTATLIINNRPLNIGTHTNTVEVSSFEIETAAANNTASSVFTVIPIADVGVSHSGPAGPVIATNLIYRVAVTNVGPQSAPNVTIMEPFAPAFAFVQATASQGGCSNVAGSVICNFGTVAGGGSAVATITLRPLTNGALTLTATASSGAWDTNSGNNSAAITTQVAPSADLALTMTGAPATLSVTSNLVYTISVTNHGLVTATNVTVTDTLPGQVTYVRHSTNTAACTVQDQLVTCNLGNLAVGGGARFTITVRTRVEGSVMNTASATSVLQDPVPANNSATVTTSITPAADLSISQTVWPEPVTEDNRTAFTVIVANLGPSPASGVTFTSRAPGMGLISITEGNANCTTNANGLITCTTANLAPGQSASVRARVRANSRGIFTNTVTAVASSPVDLNIANNTNRILITVYAGPSLAILRDGSNYVVGWAVNKGAVRLFSADSPDPAATWSRVTNPAGSFLDYNVITQQLSGEKKFFRLEP